MLGKKLFGLVILALSQIPNSQQFSYCRCYVPGGLANPRQNQWYLNFATRHCCDAFGIGMIGESYCRVNPGDAGQFSFGCSFYEIQNRSLSADCRESSFETPKPQGPARDPSILKRGKPIECRCLAPPQIRSFAPRYDYGKICRDSGGNIDRGVCEMLRTSEVRSFTEKCLRHLSNVPGTSSEPYHPSCDYD